MVLLGSIRILFILGVFFWLVIIVFFLEGLEYILELELITLFDVFLIFLIIFEDKFKLVVFCLLYIGVLFFKFFLILLRLFLCGVFFFFSRFLC